MAAGVFWRWQRERGMLKVSARSLEVWRERGRLKVASEIKQNKRIRFDIYR